MSTLQLLPSLLESLSCVILLTVTCRAYVSADKDDAGQDQRHQWARQRGRGSPRRTPLAAPPSPLYRARAQVATGVFAALIQLLAATTKYDSEHLLRSPAALVQQVASVLLLLAAAAIPLLAPLWFDRNRVAVMAAVRVMYASLPCARSPHSIQHIFKGQPAGGKLGWLADAWTLCLGCRGVAFLMGNLVAPLPLLPHIAITAFGVYRYRTTAHMCQLPMLRHPIWQRRIGWAHLAARALPFVPPPLASPQRHGIQAFATSSRAAAEVLGSSSGSSSSRGSFSAGPQHDAAAQDCQVFVAFIQLLLATASILLTARVEASGSAGPAAASAAAARPAGTAGTARHAAAAGTARRAARTAGQPQAHGGQASSRALARLGGHLVSVYGEAEGCVRCLCDMLTGRSWTLPVVLASHTLLLSSLWCLSLLLEQPGLALAVQPQQASLPAV